MTNFDRVSIIKKTDNKAIIEWQGDGERMEKPRLTLRQKRIISILVISAIIVMMCIAAWLIRKPLLSLATEPEQVRNWIDDKGIWGRLIFGAFVFLQTVIALIPGEPFEIAAGYAFGAFEGTVICVAASAIGSMVSFLLVRRYGMRIVRLFFSEEKINSIKFLRSSPKRNILIMIIFMIPGTPKDLVGYFVGLTDIKLGAWLLICTLGRLPSVITSAVGGNAIGESNFIFAVAVFAVTFAVSVGGLLLYNAICKRNNKK